MSLESNTCASARYPTASATLTIPVTTAVNCPLASSGSPVSGLRPYSGDDDAESPPSSSAASVARGLGLAARATREFPRERVDARLARVVVVVVVVRIAVVVGIASASRDVHTRRVIPRHVLARCVRDAGVVHELERAVTVVRARRASLVGTPASLARRNAREDDVTFVKLLCAD